MFFRTDQPEELTESLELNNTRKLHKELLHSFSYDKKKEMLSNIQVKEM